jgi:hypothetical protein
MEHMSNYRDNRLSENFTREEIACKGKDCCGGVAVAHPLMVRLAQAVRDYLGVPVFCCHKDYSKAGSGFRCITHNRRPEVGGVEGSYHTLGEAWDLWCLERTVDELYAACLHVIAELGYGHAILYKQRGFVHLDIHARKA